MYTKRCIQNLPITAEHAWEFLSDPKNLSTITPPSMRFEILSGADKKMFKGQIIHYYVRPLFGLKMKWITEITASDENRYFIDEQKKGPYKLWRHQHIIKPIPGGVEMEDIIDYELPFGFLGKLMHPWIVKPKIEGIFEFRRAKLVALFGEFKSPESSQ